MENKIDTWRLKSISKTLAKAEADKKALENMVQRLEKSASKLTANIVNLDIKIEKYRDLYDNVKRDPKYNYTLDLNKLS